jgi:RND family efflux transporter MFP subunit
MKSVSLSTLLLMLLTYFSACNSTTTPTAADQPVLVPVEVRPVKSSLQNRQVSASGSVEADQMVDIGFMISGKVSQVAVEEGQQVKAGQLIASLVPTDYQIGLDIVNANVAKAQDEYDRLKIMFDRGSLPAGDFSKIRTTLQEVKARQELAAKNLRDTRLVSPITGTIARRGTDPGEMVGQGMPLFTIVSTGQVKVKVAVPESEIGLIKTGQPAQVFIPSLDSTFQGSVGLIGIVADPASRTYTVKINVPNAAGLLRPGMIAEATLSSSKQVNTLTLPGEAIVRNEDQVTSVFVADAQRKQAFNRRVTVGKVLNNEVEITSGLKENELVVVGGQNNLRDGTAVDIK